MVVLTRRAKIEKGDLILMTHIILENLAPQQSPKIWELGWAYELTLQ